MKYRFECTLCGQCCRQEGNVYFDADDIKLAAAALALTPESFSSRYLDQEDGLRFIAVPSNAACPFLLDNRCSIEASKPKQCRTYPYWPELLEPAAWNAERAVCEGIGRGPGRSLEDISELLED